MLFDIFLTLLLVVLNGFFVAAEFAIVKVRYSQVEIKAKTGNQSAKIAKHILQNLDGYLSATQLGITCPFAIWHCYFARTSASNSTTRCIWNHYHITYCIWRAST